MQVLDVRPEHGGKALIPEISEVPGWIRSCRFLIRISSPSVRKTGKSLRCKSTSSSRRVREYSQRIFVIRESLCFGSPGLATNLQPSMVAIFWIPQWWIKSGRIYEWVRGVLVTRQSAGFGERSIGAKARRAPFPIPESFDFDPGQTKLCRVSLSYSFAPHFLRIRPDLLPLEASFSISGRRI